MLSFPVHPTAMWIAKLLPRPSRLEFLPAIFAFLFREVWFEHILFSPLWLQIIYCSLFGYSADKMDKDSPHYFVPLEKLGQGGHILLPNSRSNNHKASLLEVSGACVDYAKDYITDFYGCIALHTLHLPFIHYSLRCNAWQVSLSYPLGGFPLKG